MNCTSLTEEEVIDTMVIVDLKQSLEMQFDLNTDESGEYLEPDYELIESLTTVLRYYIPCQELPLFLEDVAIKLVGVKEQLESKL